MKYGQIAGNKSINNTIHRCFEYLHEKDVQKFVRKFSEQPHDGNQVMHTFRELVLGAYLMSNKFNARYDHPVDSNTPDWCILDDMSRLRGIVELVNFHTKREAETEIQRTFQVRQVWVDWMPPNDDRLYQSIWEKARVYKTLIKKHCVPYVIVIFSDFFAAVDINELHSCVLHSETGLFKLYPTISGFLFFEEKSGKYYFKYTSNFHSDHKIHLPDCVF